MTRFLMLILGVLIGAGGMWLLSAKQATGGPKVEQTWSYSAINGDTERLSYALGYQYGATIEGIAQKEISTDATVRGFLDAYLKSDTPLLSEEEVKVAVTAHLTALRQEQRDELLREKRRQLELAKEFLDENGKRSDVVTTGSGLQYRIIEEGSGPSPRASDTVRVTYKLKLSDGTILHEVSEPVDFKLTNATRGWIEGVTLMNPGAHYELFVPSDLAYGPDGIPGKIPPNAVMVYDVKLVEILEPEEQTQ